MTFSGLSPADLQFIFISPNLCPFFLFHFGILLPILVVFTKMNSDCHCYVHNGV